MGVLVVGIMPVTMLVEHLGVFMGMAVMFGKVQEDPCRHQDGSHPEMHAGGFAKNGHGKYGTDEWRGREIGTRARSAQPTQGQNEQHEAQAIAQEANQHGGSPHRGRRHGGPESKPQPRVDATRDQPLAPRNEQGI